MRMWTSRIPWSVDWPTQTPWVSSACRASSAACRGRPRSGRPRRSAQQLPERLRMRPQATRGGRRGRRRPSSRREWPGRSSGAAHGRTFPARTSVPEAGEAVPEVEGVADQGGAGAVRHPPGGRRARPGQNSATPGVPRRRAGSAAPRQAGSARPDGSSRAPWRSAQRSATRSRAVSAWSAARSTRSARSSAWAASRSDRSVGNMGSNLPQFARLFLCERCIVDEHRHRLPTARHECAIWIRIAALPLPRPRSWAQFGSILQARSRALPQPIPEHLGRHRRPGPLPCLAEEGRPPQARISRHSAMAVFGTGGGSAEWGEITRAVQRCPARKVPRGDAIP